MMRGTFLESYGTAHKYADNGLVAAAKTGTTNSNKDAWFAGFTPAYTCSVWLGYDTPKSMNGMSGSSLPAQIWNDFMTSVDKNKNGTDFTKPDSVSLRDWSGSEYTGSDKEIDKGNKTWYNCRSNGTEWYSSLNADKLTSKTKAVEQGKLIEDAKNLGESFLSYKIETVDDAKNLDSTYSKVTSAFDEIEDEYKLSDLRKSVNDRYTKLKATVDSNWKTLIDEQEKADTDKATAQAQADADDAQAKAGEDLKKARLERADWYLSMLGMRQYSGTSTSLLLEDARVAVEQLKEYSEYDSYKNRYDSETTRCNSLPSVPSNTPNSIDSAPLDESKYKEG
jgi:penicillin-binding protein 1A